MGFFGFLNKKSMEHELYCPIDGTVIPIDGAEDEVFSKRILGDGFAVIPTGNIVCAPADGRIDTVFDTRHAVSMTSDFGAEILIHCGIDTVKLGGEGFEALAASGDRVKRGDPILRINSGLIKDRGYYLTTPVVVLNCDSFSLSEVASGDRKSGERAAVLEEKGQKS